MNSSGGETRESPSGWSVDTLRQSLLALRESDIARYENALRDAMTAADLRYSQRFDAQQEAVQAALLAAKEAVATAQLAAEKAVLKAEAANDKRFEQVNEFRAALADQQRTLMSRTEYNAAHSALSDKIDALAKAVDNREGRSAGASGLWGYAVGAIGMIVAVVTLVVVLLNHGQKVGP